MSDRIDHAAEARRIPWRADPRTCDHSEQVCPTCDFDGYYAATYPDCPWRAAVLGIEVQP